MKISAQSVVEDELREVSNILPYAEITEIDSFEQPVTLFKQWQALPDDVPHYSHIKPDMFSPSLLPFMHILDVIAPDDETNDTGDVDFQFRLFGTGARDHYGKEGTSRRLSQMSHAGSGSGFDITKLSCETKTAQFLLSRYYKNDRHVKTGSFVIMPLSDDTGNVVRMFGCGIWTTPA